MRELVLHRPLRIESKVEALILRHPSLAWRSAYNNIGGKRQVLLQHWQGTRAALAAVKTEYLAAPAKHLLALELVHESRSGLLVFSVERTGYTLDLATLVERHLGPETTCSLEKNANGSTWRILTRNARAIPRFLKALRAMEEAYDETQRTRAPHYGVSALLGGATLGPGAPDLTPLERTILSRAVLDGYFDVPRRKGIAAVGKRLRMPASTALYHLRRAQRKVLAASVAQAR